MLKKKITVNSYDVGENSEIKVSALMKYMQQLAVDDIADAGATYESMRNDDTVFVIIRFALKFFSPVRKYDEIEIMTVNNQVNGITYVREYLFYRGGIPVAQATTHWVLMSFARRLPLRPSALKYDVLDIYSSPVPGGAEVFGVNRRTGKRCFESDIRFVK